MSDNRQVVKILAVAVVVLALVFVAYQEFSSLSGAASFKSTYKNCRDTDPQDNVAIRGELTTEQRLDYLTQKYETIKKTDECIGSERVRQWSCLKNHKPKVIEYKYCTGRTVCRDGACVIH